MVEYDQYFIDPKKDIKQELLNKGRRTFKKLRHLDPLEVCQEFEQEFRLGL